MSNTVNDAEIVFTKLDRRGVVPRWASRHETSREIFSKVVECEMETDVIVIGGPSVRYFISHKDEIRSLLGRNTAAAAHYHYVAYVERPPKDKMTAIKELMEVFPGTWINHMEIALGADALESSVWEAVAKQSRRNRDPLQASYKLSKATEVLRSESGRLSAKKIADALGISVAKLAAQLGQKRQTVSKTPDTKTLQPKLRDYARIIQLRAVMDHDQFKNWLNHGFPELGGMPPLEVLDQGKVDVVADFAEDALLGTPS